MWRADGRNWISSTTEQQRGKFLCPLSPSVQGGQHCARESKSCPAIPPARTRPGAAPNLSYERPKKLPLNRITSYSKTDGFVHRPTRQPTKLSSSNRMVLARPTPMNKHQHKVDNQIKRIGEAASSPWDTAGPPAKWHAGMRSSSSSAATS